MFINNTCDDRNHNNNMKSAKFHSSVIQKMPFLLAEGIYVVPPSLHITLGITLKPFNLVNKECRDLDEETSESNEDNVSHRHKVNSNWQEASLQLSRKEDELKKVSESLVDFENLVKRFQAVANGDCEENMKIAREKMHHHVSIMPRLCMAYPPPQA